MHTFQHLGWCVVIIGCVAESGSDSVDNGVGRPTPRAADAGPAEAEASAPDSGTVGWSLSQCYSYREELLGELRERLAELEQCVTDADCSRTFIREEDDACWGPKCGPVSMRGSDTFEAQAQQLYSGEDASKACEVLAQHECEFPPPSCPVGSGPSSPPTYTCAAGVCKVVDSTE